MSTPRDTGLGRGRPADMPTKGTSDRSGQAYGGPVSAPGPRRMLPDGSVSAPGPRRRLADHLLDEGALVAQTYVEQDRWDPARPSLGVLVAEAIAAAERRGEQRAQAARTADRDALLDLVGAVDRLGLEALNDDGQGGETYRGAVAYAPPTLFAVRDAARRARRHLDRTEGP